jgi:hypothetical protein
MSALGGSGRAMADIVAIAELISRIAPNNYVKL